jgi:hypothetical protein
VNKLSTYIKGLIVISVIFVLLEGFSITNFTKLRLIFQYLTLDSKSPPANVVLRDYKSLKSQAFRGASGEAFQNLPTDSPEFYKIVSPNTGEMVFYGLDDFDLTAFFFSKKGDYLGSVVFKFSKATSDLEKSEYSMQLDVQSKSGPEVKIPKNLFLGVSKNGKEAMTVSFVLGKQIIKLPYLKVGFVDADKAVYLTF